MTHRAVNILLAIILVLCMSLVWLLEPDPTEPNVQFLPGMHYSVPLNAQSENPRTPDGKTLQVPPRGTIAQGYAPLPFGGDEAGRKVARTIWSSLVFRDSLQAAERGTRMFSIYCQPCHGATGEGNGTVTRYGFPPPPSFGAANIVDLKDGEIFHTITFGKGNMPSLAGQVSREDRRNIVLRVRQLQVQLRRKQAASTTARLP